MNDGPTNFLAVLGRRAHEWAKTYTALTEALQQEGVPEFLAREEARMAASSALYAELDEEGGDSPWLV